MARNISTKISLHGEAEFRSAMKAIGVQMKELQSELSLTASDFEGMANSETALQQKGDVLSRMVELQKSKVEELRNAMLASAEANGENSDETLKLQTQLNKATVELNSMMRALDENSALLEEASGNADGLATSIDEYGKKVTVAGDNSKEFGDKASTSFSDAASALVASGILQKLADLAKKFKDITTSAAAYADSILTMSVTTGLTTTTLQEFQYASELIDVDVNTLASSLRKVTSSMNAAQSGSGTAASAYNKLGVSVTTASGELRSAEAVFWESIDALGNVANETERDAIAMELFGKKATDLNPLIAAGSEGFRKFADEAHEAGYVLSEEVLANLGSLDDSFQRFKNASEAAGNAVGAAFAPAMQNLTDAATGALTAFTNLSQSSPTFVTALGAIATGFTGVATASVAFITLKKAIDVLKPALQSFASLAGTSIAGLAASLAGVASLLGVVVFDIAEVSAMKAETDSYYETHLDEAAEAYANATQALEEAKAGIGPVADMDVASADAYVANLEKMADVSKKRYEAAQANAAAAETETEANTRSTECIEKVESAVTDLMNAYNDAYEAALKTADGMAGVFNKLSTESSMNVSEMIDNLGTQTDFFTSYAENLGKLKEIGIDDGLLSKLADGSAESAGYVQSIVNSYNELANSGNMEAAAGVISSLNSAYKESQRAMEEYATSVANTKVDIAQGMTDIAAALSDGVEDMDMSEEMSASAQNCIQGFLNGLGDGSPIYNRLIQIAQNALNAFNDTLQVASPSKKFKESGRWSIIGYIEGVKEEAGNVRKTMTESARNAITSFNAETDQISSASIPTVQSAGSTVNLNVYAQTLDEAQTDYLVETVNRRLGT